MKEISTALIKFQSKLKPIGKDSENPFFKSNYLSLSGILENVIPLLASCDLAVIQPMKITDNGTVLITKIIHSSGEFINSEMPLPMLQDPQKQGSLITYYKRYQLQAMLGIASQDDDDDGNSVSASYKTQEQRPAQRKPDSTFQNIHNLASDAQKGLIKRLMGDKAPPVDALTKQQASDLIAEINKGLNK